MTTMNLIRNIGAASVASPLPPAMMFPSGLPAMSATSGITLSAKASPRNRLAKSRGSARSALKGKERFQAEWLILTVLLIFSSECLFKCCALKH